MRFGSYAVVAIIIGGILYPVYDHWAWGGLLSVPYLGTFRLWGEKKHPKKALGHSLTKLTKGPMQISESAHQVATPSFWNVRASSRRVFHFGSGQSG